MFCMDILLAFPGTLLAIAIVAMIGPGLRNSLLAISTVAIPIYARIARGAVLELRELEFVTAARALGGSGPHVVMRHIFPNTLPPLIVQTTLAIAFAILEAAALGFLGLGAQPPTPEWGAMLADSYKYFTSGAWWVFFFPGAAIMLSVLGFNLLGDGLRDALDPGSARTSPAGRPLGAGIAPTPRRSPARFGGGVGRMWDEPLVLATRSFRSRLVVGAERYPSAEIMRRSHDAAGAELVTLAVRDLDLASPGGSLLASIDQSRFTLVATTTGCRTADEAVRTAYLARESGLGDFVKIDVVGDARTEMPDLSAVLEATRTLSRDGFVDAAGGG